MSLPAKDWISIEEYIARENAAKTKSEYFNGEIYAMAGGRAEHSQAAAELIRHLGNGLVGTGCRVYTSDLRLATPRSGLRTYPDAAVVCGPLEMDDFDPIAVVNPALLVEVVSESSGNYDRNDKFEFYKEFPTLREYLIVTNIPARIELWSRADPSAEWVYSQAEPPCGTLLIPAFGITLSVAEIFAEIEIAPRRPKHPGLRRKFRRSE